MKYLLYRFSKKAHHISFAVILIAITVKNKQARSVRSSSLMAAAAADAAVAAAAEAATTRTSAGRCFVCLPISTPSFN